MPERYRLLAAILGALTALGPLGVDMYLPAFPVMAVELGATPGAIQGTLAAFLLGMAGGQLFYGPLSDRIGRRAPLFLGMTLFTVASIGCALAASAEALTAMRLAQALGGCAGVVIARAVVRDLCDERGAVRMMAMLMLAMGAAPILAPMLGGWLLAVFDWRAIFWFQVLYGAAALLVMWRYLPESLPVELRRRDGPADLLRVYLSILGDRRFMAYALAGALPMAGLFAYLVGSPLLLMQVHGLGPVEYGFAFGSNAFGLIGASQVVSRLVRRIPPQRLLSVALWLVAAAGWGVLAAVASGRLVPVLVGFFCYMSVMGAVLPVATALAMGPMGRTAGSASALMGTIQFGVGAVIGTALGALGGGAMAMGAIIAVAATSGLVLHRVLRR